MGNARSNRHCRSMFAAALGIRLRLWIAGLLLWFVGRRLGGQA